MSQPFLFAELEPESEPAPCACDTRQSYSNNRHYTLSRCVSCNVEFVAWHNWDGTELGAYRVVESIPMPAIAFVPHPDAISTLAQFVAFCNYASRHGWRTGQDEHGNAGAIMGRLPPSDIAKLFGEFLKHGILVPF